MIFVSNCRVGLVRVRAGTRLNTNLPCRKSPWRVAAPRRWGSWHLWVESILVFRWWILRRNWTHPRALSAKTDQNISKHTVGISIKNIRLKVVTNWFLRNNGDQTDTCFINVYFLFLFRFGQLLMILNHSKHYYEHRDLLITISCLLFSN